MLVSFKMVIQTAIEIAGEANVVEPLIFVEGIHPTRTVHDFLEFASEDLEGIARHPL